MVTTYGHKHFNDVDGDVWEDEPEPTYICERCGGGIYKGDKFYRIDDREFCQACVRDRCGAVLRDLGGEVHEVKLPVCESCKKEIQGKYIVYNDCNYCEDCFTDYGEELIEEMWGKPETAGAPEE